MFQKGRPSASSLTTPKGPFIITQLKLPIGIQYTRATQRCLIEILLPGQQKKYGCIQGRTDTHTLSGLSTQRCLFRDLMPGQKR